jgi:hypothetical protein
MDRFVRAAPRPTGGASGGDIWANVKDGVGRKGRASAAAVGLGLRTKGRVALPECVIAVGVGQAHILGLVGVVEKPGRPALIRAIKADIGHLLDA